MTYAQFSAAVRAKVFPEGEAENLVPLNKNRVLDALIDLQMKIPCLQTRHQDCHTQSDTFWNCGATVFDAPRGYIQSLLTTPTNDPCAINRFRPVPPHELQCFLEELKLCGKIDVPSQTYDSSVYPILYESDMYNAAAIDASCNPGDGVFSLIDGRIWLFPFINSGETIVLEWDGIKREFSDGDTVTYDRATTYMVELYVEAEAKRKDDCDEKAYLAALAKYIEKVGDAIWNCRKERRLPERRPCFNNCDWPFAQCSASTADDVTRFRCEPVS